MTYRRRLTLIVAVSVGIAITVVAVVAYLAARSEVRGRVDAGLRDQAPLVGGPPTGEPPPIGGAGPGQVGTQGAGGPVPAPQGRIRVPAVPDQDLGTPVFVRLIGRDGSVRTRGDADIPAPSESEIKQVQDGGPQFTDYQSEGQNLRVITAPAPDGGVVQIARSLGPTDDVLSNLRTVLFLVTMAGIAISALIARFIAGRMLAPVNRLSAAAEHVSATEDLSSRIEVAGGDEIAQLATRFNTMLGRLERSRDELDSAHEEQRRLIADASHELRTPVTALRTNIELLSSGDRLPPQERSRVLTAALSQAEELGGLIADLMDLARGEAPNEEIESVRLDELASEAVQRARTHAPGVEFVLRTEPSLVEAAPERVARALNNLLDNAAAHSGDGPVEVLVGPGSFSVRDHGSGLREEEAERVFDRFYRGRDGRSRPGSGLGLAIVRQVAEAHGDSVGARSALEMQRFSSFACPNRPLGRRDTAQWRSLP